MITELITEVIFVGLPGPTHHYGGLSADNVASTLNRGSTSSPRQAALQVLGLVRLLRSLGVTAAILPPQRRPHLPLLREQFSGSDDEVIAQAAIKAPALLEKASSASAMWAANAATVAPGIDSADGKLHITPANLFTNLHRRIEAGDTCRALWAIFRDVPDCEVHVPLAGDGLHDEGDANHMRLAPAHAAKGLHVFVHGVRQSLAASRAVAARARIEEPLFIRQNPQAVARGVFHNDVIAVSNEHMLLVHEQAYEGGRGDIERIARAYRALHADKELTIITVSEEELSVAEAVHTFFFNSQIITKPDGKMAMIAPVEVRSLYDGKAARLMERICADAANPIDEIHTIDLRQSMRNGGGPACLRLRVPMTEVQVARVGNVADEALLTALTAIIEKYYSDALSPPDLGDSRLYHRSREALAAMGSIILTA